MLEIIALIGFWLHEIIFAWIFLEEEIEKVLDDKTPQLDNPQKFNGKSSALTPKEIIDKVKSPHILDKKSNAAQVELPIEWKLLGVPEDSAHIILPNPESSEGAKPLFIPKNRSINLFIYSSDTVVKGELVQLIDLRLVNHWEFTDTDIVSLLKQIWEFLVANCLEIFGVPY